MSTLAPIFLATGRELVETDGVVATVPAGSRGQEPSACGGPDTTELVSSDCSSSPGASRRYVPRH